MWTKDGARNLTRVLKRIEEVIPQENIQQRILVDDHSVDETIGIAKSFDWGIYQNPNYGIASGANEALRHVKARFFVSIEQDVLLAKNWWEVIPKYMDDRKVVVAQGLRYFTNPTLHSLDKYFGKYTHTIDNTIFRTNFVRGIGGFPTKDVIAVDCCLYDILKETNYKWVVDKTVISDHIRESVIEHCKHLIEISKLTRYPYSYNLFRTLKGIGASPLFATHITIKERCPMAFFVHPLIQLVKLKMYCLRGGPKERA